MKTTSVIGLILLIGSIASGSARADVIDLAVDAAKEKDDRAITEAGEKLKERQ